MDRMTSIVCLGTSQQTDSSVSTLVTVSDCFSQKWTLYWYLKTLETWFLWTNKAICFCNLETWNSSFISFSINWWARLANICKQYKRWSTSIYRSNLSQDQYCRNLFQRLLPSLEFSNWFCKKNMTRLTSRKSESWRPASRKEISATSASNGETSKKLKCGQLDWSSAFVPCPFLS